MSRYEVEIQLDAIVWVDVEADSVEEAIASAKAMYRLGEAQWHGISDVSVKEVRQ